MNVEKELWCMYFKLLLFLKGSYRGGRGGVCED